MREVIIIGNGIAGITAARHIRKLSDVPIKVISSESKYFWSRTALMYIYMGHMKFEHTKPYEDWFWEKNNIELIQAHVTKLHPDQHTIELQNGETLHYSHLIIATGSRHNNFGWENSDLEGVTGMISLQDLDRIEQYTKNIKRGVIVGGGLIGIELAEMLRSRNIDVTFLVREEEFWNNVLPSEEAEMISNHIREHGVDLRLGTELAKFTGDDQGRVCAAVTTSGEEIPCEFAGLTAGVHPNIDLVKETTIEFERGILINEFLETSYPNIYAVGDCAQLKNPRPGRRAIEPVWYTGRMMGETVAKNVLGNKTPYLPGPWFNSAKFFDIEYQTYGDVAPSCPEDEEELYWQSGNTAIHIRFRRSDKKLMGLNTFGLRMRHEILDQWLREGIDVSKFMSSMEEADFNPEFSEDHFIEIRKSFNEKFPGIKVPEARKKRKLFGLI